MYMCPDDEVLSAYLDNELPDDTAGSVEQQIAEDEEVSRRLSEFRAARRALLSAPEPDFEAAQARVWERIQSVKQDIPEPSVFRRRVTIPMPIAAAAAFVILISGFLFSYFALATGVLAPPDMVRGQDSGVTVRMEDREDISNLLQALNSRETVRQVTIDMPEDRRFNYRGEAQLIKATEAGALLQGEAW